MRRTRRLRAVGCCVAAAAALAACSSSSSSGSAASTSAANASLTPVTVQLGFIPNSQNYAIPKGIADGSYAKAGLKVSYKPGGIGVDPIQVVGAGKADIGVSQEDSLVIAEGKGLKLKVLGAEFGHSALGLICRTDSGVTKLSDIAGKKIAVKAIAAQNFSVLLKTNNIAPSSVTVVNVANDDSATIISGKVACVYAGLALNEPQIIKAAGVDNRIFLDSDYGLANQDNIYFTTQAYYDKHKDDVLKPWIQATQQEWAGFIDDPVKAANWVLDSHLVDGLNKDQELYQAKAMVPFLLTGYDKVNGLLALEPELWANSAKRVLAAGTTSSLVDTAPMLDTTLVSKSIS